MYSILEFFASTELRLLASGDLDGFAGLRVTTRAFRAFGNREGAKANQRHVFTLLQGGRHSFDESFESEAGLGLGDVGRHGDLFDQFVLIHGYPLSVVTPCGQSKKNLEHYSLKKAQHQAKLPEKPRKLRQR